MIIYIFICITNFNLLFAINNNPQFINFQSDKYLNDTTIGIEFDKFKSSNLSSLFNKASVELDSVKSNSITNVYINNDNLLVDVTIKDNNSQIRLSIYNMLAKEVLLIYDDIQGSETATYQKAVSSLPNGAYICVLVGSNFRDARKFLISR